MQTVQQFGADIKKKYPQYKDLDDEDVGLRVLAKYPAYQKGVTLSDDTKKQSKFAVPSVKELGGAYKDIAVGAGKGLLDSAVGTARLFDTAGKGIMAAVAPTKTYADISKEYGLKEEDKAGVDNILKSTNNAQKTGKVLAFGAELLSPTGARKAVTNTVSTIERKGAGLIEEATTLGKKGAVKLVEAVNPKPSAIEAAGQILQGKTKDIEQGVKALASVDTKGVKTFAELNKKFDEKIPELAAKVDADLALDTTKKTLKDLTVTGVTNSGKKVKLTPVETALNQLDELYTAIDDKVSSANIKEIINIAKKEGLTNKDVNDIARTYGQEFGAKAFGKTGEPLTSVNAQMYENTRKGIKAVARSGIKGNEAKKADELMSSIYNTQSLVKKNIEAVNKLQQRIKERGLLEKLGHYTVKIADTLSGGTIRGIVGGLLPRGVGNKVMNALDLEEVLASNLKQLEKAIASGTDAEIEAILKGITK